MGTDLYLVRWETIHRSLSKEEVDFIMDFGEMDRGDGYAVDKETLDELRKEEQEKFKSIIEAMRKAIEKEGGDSIEVNMG